MGRRVQYSGHYHRLACPNQVKDLAPSFSDNVRADRRQQRRIHRPDRKIVAFLLRHCPRRLPTRRRNPQHIVSRGQFVSSRAVRQRYRHSPTGANRSSNPLSLPYSELIETRISHDTRPKWPDSRNHRNLVTWPGWQGRLRLDALAATAPSRLSSLGRSAHSSRNKKAVPPPSSIAFRPVRVRRALALPLTGHRDRDGRGIDPTKEKYHG